MLSLDPDEELKLVENDAIVAIFSLTSPKTIIETPTKGYVVSLSDNNKNRRDMSTKFNDQDKEFDNNRLPNLDSNTVNRNPQLNQKLANKEYVDVELNKNSMLKLNQTKQIYLEISVANDERKLRKNDRKEITDTAITETGNSGALILPLWKIECKDKIMLEKHQIF